MIRGDIDRLIGYNGVKNPAVLPFASPTPGRATDTPIPTNTPSALGEIALNPSTEGQNQVNLLFWIQLKTGGSP